MERQFFMNLKPCKTAKDMWEYLKKVYHQGNSARQYQLEFEIANYMQGTSSIQEYYSGFQNLWTELDEIKYANISAQALPELQIILATSHRDQFLMKLRPQYESVRFNLMSRVPSPSLDDFLNELLQEEQRQLTQSGVLQQATPGAIDVAYSVPTPSQPPNSPVNVAYTTKGKQQSRDISRVQCFKCQNFDHYTNQCKQRICNYCKASEHSINECRKRPQNRNPKVYQAVTTTSGTIDSSSISSSTPASAAPVTPDMIQQMILQAFSTLVIFGKNHSLSHWYFDSGASNHMTLS
eukprot:TRINITY_DN16642_c0_g1_i12.p1 TRINITY_DN16642_c0_g1~~TRINITY_DN16642_c0_g1_i12.p1  ORF type:complete len:316 (+),score=55.55 TRINITY_DN16642_c0_g1_i12:67-948(+)